MDLIEPFKDCVEIIYIILLTTTDWLCSDVVEQLNIYFKKFECWFIEFVIITFQSIKEKLGALVHEHIFNWVNLQLNRNWYKDSKEIFIKLSNLRFQFLLWMYTTVPIFGPVTEYYSLLKWVRSLIISYHNITNFREDWTDGTALCALMERLVPGCCPRHDTLQSRHKLVNLDMGLRLAETHLGVVAHIKPDEIMDTTENSELHLQLFLTHLQSAAERKQATRKTSISSCQHYCYPRGLGLVMATANQKASFVIYMETDILSSVQVEIQGPNGERFAETITHRSPRKKQHLPPSPNKQLSSASRYYARNYNTLNIFFEYEILPDKILVDYIPYAPGRYIISVIYRGHPVFLSPFHVTVYEDSRNEDNNDIQTIHPPINSSETEIPEKTPAIKRNLLATRYGQFLSPDSMIKRVTMC